MENFITIIVTCLYVICTVNAGLLFFKQIKMFESMDILALFTVSFIMGLGLLSNLWLFLGLFYSLNKIIICLILLTLCLLTFLFRREYSYLLSRFYIIFKKIMLLSFKGRMTTLAIVTIILIFGIGSLLIPPAGDSEAFYMVWPKIISYAEKIVPLPHYSSFSIDGSITTLDYYSLSQIGFSGELHFAILISLFGVKAAMFLVWFVALSVAACILHLCTQLEVSIASKLISLVILLSSTAFTNIIFCGNVNLFASAYGLAAYYCIIEYVKKSNDKYLIICGLFAGLSVVAKFSYAPVIIPSIGLFVVLKQIYDDEKFSSSVFKIFKCGIVIGFLFIIIILPHLLKNYILFNEPFAPFVFLHGEGAIWTDQVWYSPGVTRHILLTYPIALCFGQYPMQGGYISPLIIVFIPFVLLIKNKSDNFFDKKYLYLHIGLISVISCFIWIFLEPSILAPRYILATLLLLIPSIVKSMEVVLNFNKYLLKTVIMFIIVFSLLVIGFDQYNSPYTFMGCINYITKSVRGKQIINSDYYNSCLFINKKVTNNERVYFAGYYSFFLRSDILYNINNREDDKYISSAVSFDKKIENMLKCNFSYILIQKQSHGQHFVLFDKKKSYKNFVVDKLYEDSNAVVYKIISVVHKKAVEM